MARQGKDSLISSRRTVERKFFMNLRNTASDLILGTLLFCLAVAVTASLQGCSSAGPGPLPEGADCSANAECLGGCCLVQFADGTKPSHPWCASASYSSGNLCQGSWLEAEDAGAEASEDVRSEASADAHSLPPGCEAVPDGGAYSCAPLTSAATLVCPAMPPGCQAAGAWGTGTVVPGVWCCPLT